MARNATEGASWPDLHRVRRAIVVIDVAESVRLMQEHEDDVIDRWRRFVNEVRTQLLPAHGGRLVKSLGDGLLLEFEHVAEAVAVAAELQRRVEPYNVDREPRAHIRLRCGIHEAGVVVDDLDIYGAGVNLAARLASLSSPGGIAVSAEVRDRLVPGLDPDFTDLGECFVKHLAQPIRAFAWVPPPEPSRGAGPTGAEATRQEMAHSLAVLPFVTARDDPRAELVSDVLVDSLIAALSARPELNVMSRLSSAALVGRDPLPSGFVRSLGASVALRGDCSLSGDQVRVTVELLDLRSDAVIWSADRSGRIADLVRPDNEFVVWTCASVGRELLRLDALAVSALPMPTLESHALHWGAVSLMHRSSRTDFLRVQDMLEHLIDRHGSHASPRAWMAKWHVLRTTRGLVDNPHDEARRAIDQARRAVAVDPGCALALAMEGFVHCHLRRDLETAAQRLDEACAAGPSESLAWLFRGAVHAFSDEGEAGVACVRRALALSPIDPLAYYYESLAAAAEVAAGHHQQAIELATRSLGRNAMHTSTYRTLAIAQVLAGQVDEARRTVARLLVLEPGLTIDRFRARVPAGDRPIAERFARALAEAGVPQQAG